MKSQAKSFNDFRLIVDAGIVTISRKFPNWNKNVTSGPSIFENTRYNEKTFFGAQKKLHINKLFKFINLVSLFINL